MPAADRVRQRQDAIREAERDQEAAVAGEKAVLAELRAIGLSLTTSTGVLRPVQAREVRGLARKLNTLFFCLASDARDSHHGYIRPWECPPPPPALAYLEVHR